MHPSHSGQALPGEPAVANALIGADSRRAEGRLDLAVAAVFGIVVMVILQTATPWLADNDSFYHIKMARLLPELGFVDRFPWLHWTLFRDAFVSHHHGFHVVLAPFAIASDALTGGLVLGAKAASVLSMGATALMFCVVLRELAVPRALLWLFALACAPWHFWVRLSYIRAPMVALPLLLVALWLMLRNRPRWLAVVAFALTQLYNGAVLLILLPVAFFLAALIRQADFRPALRHGAAVAVGIAAGFVLHPYFPANLGFLRTQIFDTGLGAPREAGIEWQPYAAAFFVRMCAALMIIWVVCVIVRLWRGGGLSMRSTALLLLNVLFLALTLKARRFIEYWPVFALMNAADLTVCRAATGKGLSAATIRTRSRWALIAALSAAVVGFANLLTARGMIEPSYDPAAVRGPMRFLAETSPAGSIVFTDDWDVFPYCFYWNHHNRYVVGLDPVFTTARFPELWNRYRLITRGQTPAHLPPLTAGGRERPVGLEDILTFFEADYVLVAADHPALYAQLRERPDLFQLVYPSPTTEPAERQPPFAVFRGIVPAAPRPGGPPPGE